MVVGVGLVVYVCRWVVLCVYGVLVVVFEDGSVVRGVCRVGEFVDVVGEIVDVEGVLVLWLCVGCFVLSELVEFVVCVCVRVGG